MNQKTTINSPIRITKDFYCEMSEAASALGYRSRFIKGDIQYAISKALSMYGETRASMVKWIEAFREADTEHKFYMFQDREELRKRFMRRDRAARDREKSPKTDQEKERQAIREVMKWLRVRSKQRLRGEMPCNYYDVTYEVIATGRQRKTTVCASDESEASLRVEYAIFSYTNRIYKVISCEPNHVIKKEVTIDAEQ